MALFSTTDKAATPISVTDMTNQRRLAMGESGQTDYMNYVTAAGGWGGAMVEDNIYQTSQYFDANACYETTFKDPKAGSFWSATVYNAVGRMFNDKANILMKNNLPGTAMEPTLIEGRRSAKQYPYNGRE